MTLPEGHYVIPAGHRAQNHSVVSQGFKPTDIIRIHDKSTDRMYPVGPLEPNFAYSGGKLTTRIYYPDLCDVHLEAAKHSEVDVTRDIIIVMPGNVSDEEYAYIGSRIRSKNITDLIRLTEVDRIDDPSWDYPISALCQVIGRKCDLAMDFDGSSRITLLQYLQRVSLAFDVGIYVSPDEPDKLKFVKNFHSRYYDYYGTRYAANRLASRRKVKLV